MDITKRKFKVKIIKVVSPLILPKIKGQDRSSSRIIDEQDNPTEMSSVIFKQPQTVRVFSKKKIETSSIENDRYTLGQNEENLFISNSVDQILPHLNREQTTDPIHKEETDIEHKITKKKKKKKIKLEELLQPNPMIPELELAPVYDSTKKKQNSSQSPQKTKNKFGIRKIQLLDRPNSRKEQLVPIMAPEVAIKKYSNKIKILQNNSSKLKPFVLLVDLECLGILDEAFFGQESQEEYLDEQVKIAFQKHYQEIKCTETNYKFYIYAELKEKIIYMKKLFSVILVLQRKLFVFDKVLQMIGGWFDTIVEIERIVIRDRQSIMVDYSQIFEDIIHEGIRRVVLFQNTDYTHLPMPQYPNNAALLKAIRSSITADQYIVMVQKLKEATLNDLDWLEQQIPWFSFPAYQVRVVLLQKKFYFSTIRSMMKNINSQNFNSFFGFSRIEHAIVAQMNDVQFHAFLNKNTCYKINFDKALCKLKEERQKQYIIENDLNYKKQKLNYDIAIKRYDQINNNIPDIKAQFLKETNIEKQQLAEDLFDRNQDNLDYHIERCQEIKKLKNSEDIDNDTISQISFYDIDYSQELQNYFLYITNDFT